MSLNAMMANSVWLLILVGMPDSVMLPESYVVMALNGGRWVHNVRLVDGVGLVNDKKYILSRTGFTLTKCGNRLIVSMDNNGVKWSYWLSEELGENAEIGSGWGYACFDDRQVLFFDKDGEDTSIYYGELAENGKMVNSKRVVPFVKNKRIGPGGVKSDSLRVRVRTVPFVEIEKNKVVLLDAKGELVLFNIDDKTIEGMGTFGKVPIGYTNLLGGRLLCEDRKSGALELYEANNGRLEFDREVYHNAKAYYFLPELNMVVVVKHSERFLVHSDDSFLLNLLNGKVSSFLQGESVITPVAIRSNAARLGQ